MKCINGEKAHLGQPIFSPACYRGEATTTLTIFYDQYRDTNSDVLALCAPCCKLGKRSARRLGYGYKSSESAA